MEEKSKDISTYTLRSYVRFMNKANLFLLRINFHFFYIEVYKGNGLGESFS